MRKTILLATLALGLATAPGADATKRALRTYDLTLHEKQFHPQYGMTVTSGDTIRICNNDNFQHRPFSLNQYNRFDVRIDTGECFELRAHNPTDSARRLLIYDQIHSQERIEITVLSMNATYDASAAPAPRDQEWAVYIEEDGALCCVHDVFDYYPYKQDGELPYALNIGEIGRLANRSGIRILKQGFTHKEGAEDWVCAHDVMEGGHWTRNYARIDGQLVGNLPCENDFRRPY